MNGNPLRGNFGFTLVEVMVAAAIASMIMLAISQSLTYTMKASSGAMAKQEMLSILSAASPYLTGTSGNCQYSYAIQGSGSPPQGLNYATYPEMTTLTQASAESPASVAIDIYVPLMSAPTPVLVVNQIPLTGSQYWIVNTINIRTNVPANTQIPYQIDGSLTNYFVPVNLAVSFRLQDGQPPSTYNWATPPGRLLGVAPISAEKLYPLYLSIANLDTTHQNKYYVNGCSTTLSSRTDQGWGPTDISWAFKNPPGPTEGYTCYVASSAGASFLCQYGYYYVGIQTKASLGSAWNVCCKIKH